MLSVKDNSLVRYVYFADFMDSLEDTENRTKRWLVDPQSIRFETIDKLLAIAGIFGLQRELQVPLEVIEDTRQRTGLIVSVEDKRYLLGDSAWISLKGRMNISGPGWDALTTETKALVLNERFANLRTNVLVIQSHNKVRAIMSREYSPIAMPDFFQAVLDALSGRFGQASVEWLEGYRDHTVSTARLLLPNFAHELRRTYGVQMDYVPGVLIRSSDTGYSGNLVVPFWFNEKAGGSFNQADSAVHVIHKGGNSLESIVEQLPGVFAKYHNTAKKLAELMFIELDFPLATLRKVCSKLKLGRKWKNRAIELFNASYLAFNGPTTAYDLARTLFELPLEARSETNRYQLEQKVGRVVHLDFNKLIDEVEDDEEDEE